MERNAENYPLRRNRLQHKDFKKSGADKSRFQEYQKSYRIPLYLSNP